VHVVVGVDPENRMYLLDLWRGQTSSELRNANGCRLRMWKLKRLADPENILSPGVMLTEDPGSHLKNLQTAPTIEATVDRCIQCGFCEPVCPSRNLTTTPRQRAALRREMAR
jgi:ferredoxin